MIFLSHFRIEKRDQNTWKFVAQTHKKFYCSNQHIIEAVIIGAQSYYRPKYVPKVTCLSDFPLLRNLLCHIIDDIPLKMTKNRAKINVLKQSQKFNQSKTSPRQVKCDMCHTKQIVGSHEKSPNLKFDLNSTKNFQFQPIRLQMRRETIKVWMITIP